MDALGWDLRWLINYNAYNVKRWWSSKENSPEDLPSNTAAGAS